MSSSEATRILRDLRGHALSDPRQGERLLELVYAELRQIAGRLLAGERAGHTLQPTALVHEAYLKLIDQTRMDYQDRTHFLRFAARAMRRLLIDHARKAGAEKRGGAWNRVTLDEGLAAEATDAYEVLDLDRALERFAEMDPRAAQVVELKVFGGLTVAEIADALEVSRRTVDGDWAMARMWLGRELSAD